MKISRFAPLVWGFLFLTACSSDPAEVVSSANLPEAFGKEGEIMVLAETNDWKGDIGFALKSALVKEIPGFNQTEPYFSLAPLGYENFKSFSKKFKTIIVIAPINEATQVSTLIQNRLGVETIKATLKQNLPYKIEKDVWARGQTVIFMFEENNSKLVKGIQENEAALLELMGEIEASSMIDRIEKIPANKALQENVKKEFGLSFSLPETYRQRIVNSDFIWVSRDDKEKSLNLFAFSRPAYSKTSISPDSILYHRDAYLKKFVPGPSDSSYMITEILAEPFIESIDFQGKEAVRIRTLWKVENDFMGGPMITFTVLDPKTNKIYEFIGSVYHPKGKKRELIRELETIITHVKL